MASGRACRTEFQNASVVWPDSVRPDASVIVPEMMIGRSMPASSNACRAAKIAALAFSVSKIVSISSRSTPPSISARAPIEVGRGELVEVDVAERRIVDVRRQRRRAVRRPERAGDERTCAGLRGVLVRRVARDLRGRRG